MPQVKITIKDDLYKKLKKAAEKNYRTATEELNYRLAESFDRAPLPSFIPSQPFTPPTDPILNPPYKVTLDTQPEISTTTHTTTSSHKDVPDKWLREHGFDPSDTSDHTYECLKCAYPDITREEFITIQTRRQNAYKPDASDPYDPMTNNPYARKSVIG